MEFLVFNYPVCSSPQLMQVHLDGIFQSEIEGFGDQGVADGYLFDMGYLLYKVP